MKTIGGKIKLRRQELKLTQRKLAAKAGISAGYLGHIERDQKHELGLSVIRSLAAALDVPYEYLLSNPGEEGTGSTQGHRGSKSVIGETSEHYLTDRHLAPLLLEPEIEGPPVEHWLEGRIDLHEALIRDPSRTVVVRAAGNSLREADIHRGDLVIADMGISPLSGDIVVARLNGAITIKRYVQEQGVTMLFPRQGSFAPLVVGNAEDLEIIGVVTYAIRAARQQEAQRGADTAS